MLVFTPVLRREGSTDTPARHVTDIITGRDIIEDIGRLKKDGVPTMIEKNGMAVTTVVMADINHEDELKHRVFPRPFANPVGTGEKYIFYISFGSAQRVLKPFKQPVGFQEKHTVASLY